MFSDSMHLTVHGLVKCTELCWLKHCAIFLANPHRKLAWLFSRGRAPSTSYNLTPLFNVNALTELFDPVIIYIPNLYDFLSSIKHKRTVEILEKLFVFCFFRPHNKKSVGSKTTPQTLQTTPTFVEWSENTFFQNIFSSTEEGRSNEFGMTLMAEILF